MKTNNTMLRNFPGRLFPPVALLLLMVFLTFGTIGCKPREETAPGSKDSEKVVQGEVIPVFAVATTQAVEGELIDYLELNGDVQTKSSVDIYPDTYGKVSKLYVNVGDRVAKDQVIAEIDPSRPGSIFVPSPVKSPIAGTITSIPVYVGSTLTQGMPVARITTTDRIEIRTDVAERFIGKMRMGLNVQVSFEAFPGETFRGRVVELNPIVDPTTRSLEVKIRLDQQDARIRPGMFAAMKIITERKQGVVKIPSDCLVRRFGESYVFVLYDDPTASTGKRVERRKVIPGLQIDEKLEIVQGLQNGEEVVIQGQTLLEDKSVVKVVSTVPPLPVSDRIQ
ncbi:MAG TPA: efflux RND transporter periplasmic adaptor subunit [Spirochaetales bacterium]|nr:efflux RND transporter periplasmic adaptor subunit [Spirochaetales bacterium]